MFCRKKPDRQPLHRNKPARKSPGTKHITGKKCADSDEFPSMKERIDNEAEQIPSTDGGIRFTELTFAANERRMARV